MYYNLIPSFYILIFFSGKRKRDETYHIPMNIIQIIKEINSKNIQSMIQDNLINEIRDKNANKKIKICK